LADGTLSLRDLVCCRGHRFASVMSSGRTVYPPGVLSTGIGGQDRLMDQQDVSPEPLAAQGLGEADPVSGGLAPVIYLSTNYEQHPDGSYREGRGYTRAEK